MSDLGYPPEWDSEEYRKYTSYIRKDSQEQREVVKRIVAKIKKEREDDGYYEGVRCK